MIGKTPAQAAAKIVMLSAMRLTEVRQSDRVRKNSDDTSVPPDAMPIHQT